MHDSEQQSVQLEPGTKVGPYEIQGTLGAGGMGTVYRARDPRLGRDVALKFLSGAYSTGGDALERFHREARAISALNHPNVCTIYDIGEDQGRPFLVMELLEGQTLKQRIASGRISNDELIRIALQVSNALEAAHSRGLVHRDIKPANIFLTSSGATKILDFGLAKTMPYGHAKTAIPTPPIDAAITAQDTLTKSGVTLGTVSYLSPEQARGEDVDARSDLFAFGIVLYEMAARVLPFTGDTWPVILSAILERTARPPRELNSDLMPELEAVIEKALEKDKRTRYQTASDLQSDLLRAQRKLESSQTSVAEVRPRKRRTNAVALTALVAVVLAAVFAAKNFYLTNSTPTSPSEYVQITNFSDSAIWPNLSPDGRMVTFLRGGGTFPTHGQIYAKLLPNGEAVQLTSGDATRFSPVFTPDGSRIAYTQVQASPTVSWDTWTVPTFGGSPSRFLPNASGLTWINPGSVLFSEIKSGLHMGIVMASEGRANEREIYFPDHERAMAHLSWASPDKKSALISEMDRTAIFQQCRLASLDGSSPDRLVGPVGSCTSAGWSPDGRLMYFSVGVDGTSHLWRERFPDGKPEQITFGPTEEEGIALAPDGKSIVTSVGLQHSTVWFHDAGGDRPISSEGLAYAPRLSLDGKHLYYLLGQHADATSSELRVVDLASNKTDNLLPGLFVTDYDISRDERYVVYSTKRPGEEPQIWYASLDRASPPRSVVRGGARPSFGANDEIIFQEFGQKTNYLGRIRIDGSQRERVIDSPILNKLSVSPDGVWAGVLMAAPGQEAGTQMVAIPLAGGEPRRLCSFACAPIWSSDGKIMFIWWATNRTTAGTTLAIPIPPGKGVPDLPESGLSSQGATTIPNVQVIPNVVQSPGPNLSTYAFLKTEVQRNLFRIPLH